MNQHTPGPWQITNGCDIFTRLGAENAHGIEAPSNDGWHVATTRTENYCTIDGEEVRIARSEQQANNRLIAAAPDLLEALQRIVTEGDYTAPEGMKRIAREAIAKAANQPKGE